MAQTPTSRPKSQPHGSNLGLKTGIWALRLGYGLEVWGGRWKEKEEEKEEEEEKIPHMCESIGHRPLGAAAQNADQPTNRLTDRTR